MGTTNIQWTASEDGSPGYTFNPWIGCRKVAPECKNCYAETLDIKRFSKTMPGCSKEAPVSHWGSGPRYRTSESNWREPLKWNRKAAKDRVRKKVFCASLSDWLDDENVPIEWLVDLLNLIRATPDLDWLLLTKRPQNWKFRMMAASKAGSLFAFGWLGGVGADWPPNVWIGVSAGADQAAALAIPAKIHFLSCEPMLHPVDLSLWIGDNPINEGSISGREDTAADRSGIRDRREGENLEDGGASRNSRIAGNTLDSMREKEGRASSSEGVSSNQGDSGREEDQCVRASAGVALFQRADSRGDDSESQVWEKGGQPTGKTGVIDAGRQHPPCGASVKDAQSRQSGRGEKFYVQGVHNAGSGDPIEARIGRETDSNSEGFRNKVSTGFTDSEGRPSKKWVICGGESGKNARPCFQEWIREAVAQCRSAGIPVFVKQLGANSLTRQTKERDWKPFRDSHGGDMSEWPEDLRVREFPTDAPTER